MKNLNWKECQKHSAVYYDSSVHKKCPACETRILKLALSMWALQDKQNHDFAYQILEWIRLALDVIQADPMLKQNLIPKRDLAHQKATETQKRISEDYTCLTEFLEKNSMLSIFDELAVEAGINRDRPIVQNNLA
jgi:hypothetical protein